MPDDEVDAGGDADTQPRVVEPGEDGGVGHHQAVQPGDVVPDHFRHGEHNVQTETGRQLTNQPTVTANLQTIK